MKIGYVAFFAVLLSMLLLNLLGFSRIDSMFLTLAVAVGASFIVTLMLVWQTSQNTAPMDIDFEQTSKDVTYGSTGDHNTSGHASVKQCRSQKRYDASTVGCADVIFEKWTQIETDVQQTNGKRVFLLGSAENPVTESLLNALKTEGYSIDICTDLDAILASILESSNQWVYLFLDLDFLEGVLEKSEVVDGLMDLRESVPSIITIIMSEDFQQDDFATHRLAVTDISLKLPVMSTDLTQNLLIAQSNNKIWCNRWT